MAEGININSSTVVTPHVPRNSLDPTAPSKIMNVSPEAATLELNICVSSRQVLHGVMKSDTPLAPVSLFTLLQNYQPRFHL